LLCKHSYMIEYKKGDLIVVRGRALKNNANTFSIGVVLSNCEKHKSLGNRKELIWAKVYRVLTQRRIIEITYYDIKGKI